MRLVESAAFPDAAALDRVFELVHGFVTHGPVGDSQMDEVMRLWPRPQAARKLWRVQVLSRPQAKQLPGGLTIPAAQAPAFRHGVSGIPFGLPRLAG